MRPTWAGIDTAAFGRNVRSVAASLPPGSRLIAVLKADAYGHGAAELARHCHPDSVAMIATSLLEEALEIQDAGVGQPLLVLGPLEEPQIGIAAARGIAAGIIGPAELEAASHVARERPVRIHLKLDSGMGRMGLIAADLARAAAIIRSSPNLVLEAIYTHFASAGDPADPMTDQQIRNFESMLSTLAASGVTAPLHHRANSAATVRGLVNPGDWVRAGLVLYGGEPLDSGRSRLEPVMTWRTAVARLKELPADQPVGYGATYRTARQSRIATLPVGYADGYDRLLSNCGTVLVRGKRAPVVGRVSMDLVTIDVTGIPEAAEGDEVILLGRQGEDEITAEEIAVLTGTISYEVFCNVSARVPRIYRINGETVVHSRFAGGRTA